MHAALSKYYGNQTVFVCACVRACVRSMYMNMDRDSLYRVNFFLTPTSPMQLSLPDTDTDHTNIMDKE